MSDLGRLPRGIRFTGTAQAVRAFAERRWAADATAGSALLAAVPRAVAGDRVGDRPDRVEPRRRKRRPKPYPLLTEPRADARNRLLQSAR